jgi:hypothetical protein
LLFNAAAEGVEFVLPKELPFDAWEVAAGTETGAVRPPEPDVHEAGATLTLGGRSLVVLRGLQAPEDARG